MAENHYHHGDLKPQLIREGLKLLDEEGYDAFSLRKVAKACHVSHTAPYRHFQNKEELISAIIREAMMAFNMKQKEAVDLHPDDPAAQLSEMGVAYVTFFAEHPDYFKILFLRGIDHRELFFEQAKSTGIEDIHIQDLACNRADQPYFSLENVVARYWERNTDQTIAKEEIVLCCWGIVHGLATLMATGELPMAPETMAIIKGMLWKLDFLK